MPVRFSTLLRDDSMEVRSRHELTRCYQSVKRAVHEGGLKFEGHSLAATFNHWLALLESEPPLKTDRDVVDFSLADDAALARWKDHWRQRAGSRRRRTVSANAFELFSQLQDLETAYSAGMAVEVSNGKKDDLQAALSDLQAAVALLFGSYDKVQAGLRLPDRQLPREALRPRTRKKRTRKEAQAAIDGKHESPQPNPS